MSKRKVAHPRCDKCNAEAGKLYVVAVCRECAEAFAKFDPKARIEAPPKRRKARKER